MKPVLAKLYQTQVSAVQQSASSFIAGYREGAAEKVDLSAIFPRPPPPQSEASRDPATEASTATHHTHDGRGAGPVEAENVAEELRSTDQGSTGTAMPSPSGAESQIADSSINQAMLRSMLASSGPGSQASHDPVSQALAEAERLAAGMLSGAGATPSQRRQLEAAIQRAEAAMKAAEGLSQDPSNSNSNQNSDSEPSKP